MNKLKPGYVKQTNKKTGTVYVYENNAYWSKEKKQMRSNRRCVGILDEVTGEIVPTKGLYKTPKIEVEPIQLPSAKRSFYGSTYLLNEIGLKIGLIDDLKRCFPRLYLAILSIAFYLLLEPQNSLRRFKQWNRYTKHPYGDDISSQRSSDIFGSITETSINEFFRLQSKRRVENEYWAYDITSISSYSELLAQVRYGYNKENDNLPQINLAILYGEESSLPFYYRKLSGNVPDSKTVDTLLENLSDIGIGKCKLVLDRGCYSKDNINKLLINDTGFLMGTKTSIKIISDLIEYIYDRRTSLDNYNDEYNQYGFTKTIDWSYNQLCATKESTLTHTKKIFVHIFYNPEKALKEEQKLTKKLFKLRTELLSCKRVDKNKKAYIKFFDTTEKDGKTIEARAKTKVIDKIKLHYGFHVILSNTEEDAWETLCKYRAKDVAEKAFENIKERLNMRRTLVSSEKNLDGKLFVQFIALILLSYINKQMQVKKMYKDYTMQDVLDELNDIECFEYGNGVLKVGEVLEKQKLIFANMEVETL
jgi:transposase